MTNITLYHSSCACSVIHICALLYYKPVIAIWIIMIAGMLSSILNHRMDNVVAIYFDRSIMVVGFGIDAYYTILIHYNVLLYMLLLVSVATYVLSKISCITALHVSAHVAITIFHVLLLHSAMI